MNRIELLKKREEKLDEIAELKAEVKELELEINSLGSKYESFIIFNVNTSKEKMQEIKEYIKMITDYYYEEDIGVKLLAYMIKGQEKGYYYLIQFEGNEEKVKNLERYYRIKDEIMKFVTVKKWEDYGEED